MGGGGEPVQLTTAGLAPARAIIPRERFCALAHDGGLVAEPMGETQTGAWADQPPVGFKLAEMEGGTAVFDEACP